MIHSRADPTPVAPLAGLKVVPVLLMLSRECITTNFNEPPA
jgi:hypothetical protein